MRIFIVILLINLAIPTYAAEITIKQETIDSFIEMGITDIPAYLDSIAESHETQKIENEFKAKTLTEKQDLLKK